MELDRRGFLGACAGCAAPCALKATAPAQTDGKTSLRVVFARAPKDVEGWPYVNFDYESKQKELLANLRAQCPYADFQPAAAENEAESKVILEKDAEVDGYMVFILGIPNRGAARAVAMSGRPTVLVDHLYGGTGDFLGLYGPARKAGKPVAGVSSSKFADVAQAVRALHTLKQMKGATILDVTKRDPARMTEAIRAAYGAEVVKISGTEINDRYEKVSDADAKDWAATWTKGAEKIIEPTKQEIHDGARMYVAMKNLMAERKSRAITVDCLDLFYAKQLRAYPCLGFFQLNNDNAVGACEADLTSTSTMLLMSHLIEQPGYISDPVIDTSKSQIIYAHCVAMNRVYGPKGPANKYHIRSHSEDRKGAAVRSLFPIGVMTTTLEFIPGAKEVVMHQAKTVENIDEDKACRTKLAAEVKDPYKLMENWKAGWHRVTYFGDHRAAVDNLAALLGFQVTIEG
jgi:hypothetical protein